LWSGSGKIHNFQISGKRVCCNKDNKQLLYLDFLGGVHFLNNVITIAKQSDTKNLQTCQQKKLMTIIIVINKKCYVKIFASLKIIITRSVGLLTSVALCTQGKYAK